MVQEWRRTRLEEVLVEALPALGLPVLAEHQPAEVGEVDEAVGGDLGCSGSGRLLLPPR